MYFFAPVNSSFILQDRCPLGAASILSSRHSQASSEEGAWTMLRDPVLLSIVQDALKRPASGTAYTQWASSLELKLAARTATNLLQFCGQAQESESLQRSLRAAALAALTIQPESCALITELLSKAEQTLAGTQVSTRLAVKGEDATVIWAGTHVARPEAL